MESIKTEQPDDKANKSFERWRAMQPYAGATERERKAFLAGFSAAINGPLPTQDELMKRLIAGMNPAINEATIEGQEVPIQTTPTSKKMDYYKCPFCGGTKIKPFVRNGGNQNCTECNKDGMISQKKIVEYGIEDCIDGYNKSL